MAYLNVTDTTYWDGNRIIWTGTVWSNSQGLNPYLTESFYSPYRITVDPYTYEIIGTPLTTFGIKVTYNFVISNEQWVAEGFTFITNTNRTSPQIPVTFGYNKSVEWEITEPEIGEHVTTCRFGFGFGYLYADVAEILKIEFITVDNGELLNYLIKDKGKHTIVEHVKKTRQVWYTPQSSIPTPSSGGVKALNIPTPPSKTIEQTYTTMIPCVKNGKTGGQIAVIKSDGTIVKLIGSCIINEGLGI